MTPDFAVELMRAAIVKSAQIATPILMIGMTIGLSVSVVQAVTSVSEQTLSFVPKTLGILSFIVIATPWIFRNLIDFTRWMIQLMPQVAG